MLGCKEPAMFIPAKFRQTDFAEIRRFIAAQPLATLVVQHENRLQAAHIPLFWYDNGSEWGALRGHFAKANLLWQAAGEDKQWLAVFQDSGCYISPNWYPSKARDHKAVPTWNYQAVHFSGRLTLLDDIDSTLAVLSELSRIHEAEQTRPWQLADAPPDYIQAMCKALKCFEFTIEQVEATYKLSQNQSAENRSGVVEGLQAKGGTAAEKMAEKVQRFAPDS